MQGRFVGSAKKKMTYTCTVDPIVYPSELSDCRIDHFVHIVFHRYVGAAAPCIVLLA